MTAVPCSSLASQPTASVCHTGNGLRRIASNSEVVVAGRDLGTSTAAFFGCRRASPRFVQLVASRTSGSGGDLIYTYKALAGRRVAFVSTGVDRYGIGGVQLVIATVGKTATSVSDPALIAQYVTSSLSAVAVDSSGRAVALTRTRSSVDASQNVDAVLAVTATGTTRILDVRTPGAITGLTLRNAHASWLRDGTPQSAAIR